MKRLLLFAALAFGVAAGDPSTETVHEVEEGETLKGIANRAGVPEVVIAEANGLSEPYVVKLGQKLIIPAVLPERAAAAAPRQPYFRRPHDGKVLLGWKRRPDGGGHAGIDFAVATGDMIRAAASGTVVAVTEDKERWGKRVVIDHGNGWQSAYGQLARTTVSVGDPIKAGERLGIGGKGKAEAPEFHFEIRRDGRLVDPAPLLRLKG